MPDLIAHVQQAHHNLHCAAEILKDPSCRDWAITAAFYAAIHFVEAGLTSYPSTELKDLIGDDGYHNQRQELVRVKFTQECYRNYRKLREASQNVRYLVNWGGRKSSTGTSLGYYSLDDATKMVSEYVSTIKNEIEKETGIDLSK